MESVGTAFVAAFVLLGTAIAWATGRIVGARVGDRVAADALAAGATLLDVRAAAEYRSGHAPGAVHVPVNEITSRADELARDRPVVVYCRSGGRATTAARRLKALGFTVYNVRTTARARAAVARASGG